VVVDGQMRQVCADLFFAHFVWMAFIVEEDEAANPAEVSGFGPNAVMLDAQMPADAVE
jgi:hypothetical protein